ncbi:formyl transferase [Chiua virens]|nr:formyl transferase [Chiua virens]
MLFHRHGHPISAFTLAHHRRFAGPPIHTTWRQLSNRTLANVYPLSIGRLQEFKRLRVGASRSSDARYHSGTVSCTKTSFPNAQRFVRDPFKILFCGRDLFSCAVFKEVYEAKDVWDSLHVVTNVDIRAGRRGSRLDICMWTLPLVALSSPDLLLVAPLKLVGEGVGVPVHTIPEDKVAFRKWLPPLPFTIQSDSQNAPHLLVTASFGRILPKNVLSLFPTTQRLNVHPSLLAAYRGPAPIQRALMAGEQETGVCVIEMGEVSRKAGKLVDAGNIWAVERTCVPEDADFLSMQDVLAASGGKLLVQVLRDMLSGRARSRPQEAIASNTAHAPLITAADAAIHFGSQTCSCDRTTGTRHRASA